MADQPPPGRLYDDRQIGALIKRAAELQESDSHGGDRGLTLHEIERIAAEIGIAPAHLRAAAVDLESAAAGSFATRVLGGPFTVGASGSVEGSLSDEQWEGIVAELRRLTGSSGSATMVGRRREWTRTVSDLGNVLETTEVVATPHEGHTRIELRSRFGGGARLAYLAGLLLGGGAAGAVLDGTAYAELMNWLILGGGGLGGIGAARLSIGYWARRKRESLRTIATWLQRETASDAASPIATDASAPQLRAAAPTPTETL